MRRLQLRPFLSAVLVSALLPLQAADAASFTCDKQLSREAGVKVLDSVEKRYQGINDIEAKFVQTLRARALDQEETSRGDLRFKKPGRMDWNYVEPEPQRAISNGRMFWFYEPNGNQVTLADFDESFNSELPVSFLLGIGKLKEKFVLDTACSGSDGITLELSPIKSDKSLGKFSLLVRQSDSVPLGARISDLAQNETTIVFSDIAVNKKPSDAAFEFEIPRGVFISDQRKKSVMPTGMLKEQSLEVVESPKKEPTKK